MLRVLLRLRKGEEIKYLSHRDVIRAFEFALRRARIDTAYSSGFNPRPRMSFGSAIGVGVTSEDERIVLELASPQADIVERLNSQFPNGLAVLEAEEIPEGMKSPLSGLNAVRFRLTLKCEPAEVNAAIEKLLASDVVKVIREREGKTKEIDIRPYIMEAGVVESGDSTAVVDICLRVSDSGGGSPKDFVQALGNLVSNMTVRKIHKLSQFHIE